MSAEAEVPPDALVIRFKPMDADRCLKRLDQDHRDTGYYCLSVFADTPRSGESEDQLRHRLLAASEMQGILASSNKAYYVCTRAENLLEQGFTFRKDDDGSMEVAEHYSVDFGPDAPTVEDVNRFIKSFDPDPVRRPK